MKRDEKSKSMNKPLILAIDTSCDETSVAVTQGRRVLSNERYSQILMHTKWGGVVPNLAKRAHEEQIDQVVESALKKARTRLDVIDFIAVTFGPGLAIALGVGIDKAKELAKKHDKKLIAVNHMEGHIYSCFVQNAAGNPENEFRFPYIALLVSGAHTELVFFKDHINYEVIGETLDDAAGEALDKAARMLLGSNVYPGGPVVEQLAKKGNPEFIQFPRPMLSSKNLNFSYSGLKTALLYYLKGQSKAAQNKQIHDVAASFQEAVFDSLLMKLNQAIKKCSINNIVLGGGVVANARLRLKARQLVKKHGGTVLFPPSKNFYGDNAAMIGVAAYYKAEKNLFVSNMETLDRSARARLS